jgi:hypothetical protein
MRWSHLKGMPHPYLDFGDSRLGEDRPSGAIYDILRPIHTI